MNDEEFKEVPFPHEDAERRFTELRTVPSEPPLVSDEIADMLHAENPWQTPETWEAMAHECRNDRQLAGLILRRERLRANLDLQLSNAQDTFFKKELIGVGLEIDEHIKKLEKQTNY